MFCTFISVTLIAILWINQKHRAWRLQPYARIKLAQFSLTNKGDNAKRSLS